MNSPFLSWGNTQSPVVPMGADMRAMGIPTAGGGMSSFVPDMQAWGNQLMGQSDAQMNPLNFGVPGAAAGAVGTNPSLMNRFGSWMGQQNLGDIAQGLGALGGLWQSRQGLGLARDNLNFQREAFNTNLNNSIQSYNTRLEDRIRGRTANPNENDVRSYLERHSLGRG